MNIALVEPQITGHRITYLKCYAKALVGMGHNVHIYAPKSNELTKNNEGNICFYEYNLPAEKSFILKRFDWSLNLFNKWIHLSHLINENSPDVDLVFFITIDFYKFYFSPMIHSRLKPIRKLVDKILPSVLDTFFKFKWAGLSLHPQYGMNLIYLSRNCVAIGLLNEFHHFGNEIINRKKIIFLI